MSLLSHDELVELVATGVLSPVAEDNIGSTSIDITLGDKILSERAHAENGKLKRVYLDKKSSLAMAEFSLERDGEYTLYPGEFILAQSAEVFNLPLDITAEYRLKSSMARLGLNNLYAGYCDPGWHGSVLTLELHNCTRNHEIVLRKGDKIGQMIFFRHAPVRVDKSYAVRGSYNGDKEARGVKTK